METTSEQGFGPEFIRLPKKGKRCPLTGLSRSALYELIAGENPVVMSKSIVKPGRSRGTRLIVVSSLLNWVHQADSRRVAPRALELVEKAGHFARAV